MHWLQYSHEIRNREYSTLVRYLHEHDYARRIPRPMPEPPDREAWEEQREVFAAELVGLLEVLRSVFKTHAL